MTNPRLIPNATKQFLKTLDATGAKLPKSLHAEINKRLENANTIGDYRLKEQSIADALHDAITDGRDPLTDPAVQRAALVSTLSGSDAISGLADAAHRRLGDVVTENIDTLITALKGPFDAAGKQLADAHATIKSAGLSSFDDPSIIQSRSGEVVTAGAQARVATDTLTKLDNALNPLLNATDTRSRVGESHPAFRFDMGDHAFQGIRRLTYWDALDRGYTISLATRAEKAARIQRAEEVAEAQEREVSLTHEAARKARSLTHAGIR